MNRILVMRAGALGDFILTLPVLAALRRQWPRATIELAGHPHIAALGLEAGLVDAVTRFDDPLWAALLLPDAELRAALRDKLAACDLIVSFTPDADHTLEGQLRRACRGQVIVHPPTPTSGHAAAHLLAALEPLGLRPAIEPTLTLPAERVRWGERWLDARGVDRARPLVAIHPGSGSARKCWPWERFERVARELADRHGCDVLLTFGPADERLQARAERVLGAHVHAGTGLSVVELAAVLSLAACCVGNDSGVTHLAAALGVRTVAVFGPTDPAVWGPLGERVTIVQGQCPEGPCSRERRWECARQVCLERVSVEEVVAAVCSAME